MKIRSLFHIHSDWSYDGKWSLEKITKVFRRLGIRAIFTFEHDRDYTQKKWQEYREYCASLSNEEFIIVPGIEYSDPNNRVHICVSGLDRFLGEGLDIDYLLKKIKEHKGTAILAHPARKSAWKDFKPSWAEALLGVEIWNRKVDGWTFNRKSLQLVKENKLFPFIGLDFHRKRQIFPLWLKLEVEKPLSIVNMNEALQKGNFTPVVLGMPAMWLSNNFFINFTILAEKSRKFAVKILSKDR